MLKIGVLGAGHLGKIHIRLLKEIKEFQLVGFFDADAEKAAAITQEFEIPAFDSIESLLREVDVIDIVTPTIAHYDGAMKAIKAKKHFFIEKPLTNTLEEAAELVNLVNEAGLKAQVGHVERFNPAFIAAQPFGLDPMFVEAHRLAEFKPRGTDVSVVLDLMIHDIDILLSMVKSKVETVSASGVPVISDTIDIANARIEFENGCVANLTASRVSLKTERKMRIFQKNAYISMDFFKKELNVFKLKELQPDDEPESEMVIDPGGGKLRKELFYSSPVVPETNAIKLELELFARAIINDTEPPVSLQDGYNSMMLAQQILDKIEALIQKSKKATLI
jgi:predicted dehydrogenase